MFAQLTSMQCIPYQLDEFAQLYAERVIPITQAQMGYRGLFLLVDRANGKVVAISLWDSEEDAATYERSLGHRDQLSRLDRYLASAPDGACYEVSVDA